MDVWVLIDSTNKTAAEVQTAFQLLGHGVHNIKCAHCSSEELHSLYKKATFDICPDKPFFCYHPEAVNTWYHKYISNDATRNQKYKYFWFWEDDLVFSGDISLFFASFDGSEADLVAINNEKSDVLLILCHFSYFLNKGLVWFEMVQPGRS